jgi:ESCRT-II complex subunit VPS36
VTSHRLFYIDAVNPHLRSFVLDLSGIVKTKHFAGLFTSSPKVTIYLVPEAPALTNGDDAGESWRCEICDFRNPPGASPTSAKCALCGVPRSNTRSAAPTPPRAVSAPPSSTYLVSSPPTFPGNQLEEVACLTCTFLNHPSLTECEICGTALPRLASPPMNSAPSSRPVTPPNPDEAGDDSTMLRLSFRKSGDKALYAVLKRSILGKAWQVRAFT